MSGLNILVTGGAGYIGSHVCKCLAQAGHNPITYDSLENGHRWAVQWGPLEEGDITDRLRLDQVFRKHRPHAVMHFAAYAYVGESVQNPGKYYHNNVAGSITLLETMRDHKVDKIIFSSTCATYGIPDFIPIAENHLQNPVSPYGASKLMIERVISDFGHAHDIKSVYLRYFNAAGADPDGILGEDHTPETHLIPLVIKAALGQIPKIDVYGTDYDTPDGTAIRDYIHVTDLAFAHNKALTYLFEGGGSIALNLGTGRGHSVREVIASVEKVTGKTVPVQEAPRRPGDPPMLISDATKAAKLLNLESHYSDLSTIVETALRWHANS